jgi:TetR/AcrR family transcriptional repressor of mexJK operon
MSAPATHPVLDRPKRRAITEAATRLFLRLGYGAVSMDAVARESGVSKATLYAHFTGKDRLFATIVAERCRRLQAQAEADPAWHGHDVRTALTAMGRHWLTFLMSPDTLAIFRVVIAEAPRFPELAATFYDAGPRAMKDWLTGWVAAASADRLLSVADPLVAAEQFLALLRTGAFFRATLGVTEVPTEVERNAVVDHAVATFLRAFGPGDASGASG